MSIFGVITCETCNTTIGEEEEATEIEGLGSGRFVCEPCWLEN